jgi:hypothetical protein
VSKSKNDDVLGFVKNTWFLPAIILLLLTLVVVKKFDFSLTGYVADKVIQKLEADYNPYGPSYPANTPGTQPAPQPQPGPQPPWQGPQTQPWPPNPTPPPWVRPPNE